MPMVRGVKLINGLLISDCLENIGQYVSWRGSVSSTVEIICGFLQGSVLGSLLFLLCTDDPPNALSLRVFMLFADDSNVFRTENNIPESICTS